MRAGTFGFSIGTRPTLHASVTISAARLIGKPSIAVVGAGDVGEVGRQAGAVEDLQQQLGEIHPGKHAANQRP
ncbi:hypothetical protein GCM10017600_87840 [Streptosporangium carneum]|uniref:Uncharacterized protein n=1 Tax=Streptosporangium carneum TaxID=47481 RepID=A0A9W6MIG7_9ACTN|nr:hypothetical protein GCM10017600_87840 [Streptosporangium carneum]